MMHCQSGNWSVAQVEQITEVGYVRNNEKIPIPSGYSPSDCSWIASAFNNTYTSGHANRYSGNYTSVNPNRTVFCGMLEDGANRGYSHNICSYVITCSK